jgi:hypothetical protein
VVGGYDGSAYRSELIHAIAPDGERIPVSMVYRADRHVTAPSPMREGRGSVSATALRSSRLASARRSGARGGAGMRAASTTTG